MSLTDGPTFSSPTQDSIRVLLVEDSAVVRAFLRKFIESDPELRITSTATNGQVALDRLKSETFDVVVLDIEMPVMDGLTALPLILKADPDLQVIIASTLTKENAVTTMQCLRAGAAECIAKPTAQEIAGSDNFRRSLAEKVKTLGLVTRKKRRVSGKAPAASAGVSAPAPAPKSFPLRRELVQGVPDAIAVGSSTGGPQALLRFFSDLKNPLRQPVFITQHMPPTFTTILAEHIVKQSGLACHEGIDGEVVKDGMIYLAPGDWHMTVRAERGQRIIALNQNPAENFCRPSVDPMLRSLIEAYGARKLLGVILTGMGSDGCKGCQALADGGGTVLAQDEATSVVWGMPGAVAMAGICSSVLPLGSLADEVRRYANRAGGA